MRFETCGCQSSQTASLPFHRRQIFCLMIEALACEQFYHRHYMKKNSWELNLWSLDLKSDILTTTSHVSAKLSDYNKVRNDNQIQSKQSHNASSLLAMSRPAWQPWPARIAASHQALQFDILKKLFIVIFKFFFNSSARLKPSTVCDDDQRKIYFKIQK